MEIYQITVVPQSPRSTMPEKYGKNCGMELLVRDSIQIPPASSPKSGCNTWKVPRGAKQKLNAVPVLHISISPAGTVFILKVHLLLPMHPDHYEVQIIVRMENPATPEKLPGNDPSRAGRFEPTMKPSFLS